MIPLPDRLTLKRRDLHTQEKEYDSGEETIDTGIKGLISPASGTLEDGILGPMETFRDMIFLEPGVDVRDGDILMDESNDERWQVVGAAQSFKNPITWQADHIEVFVARAPEMT